MENPISISESADEVSKNSSGDDVNTEPVDGSGKKDEPQVSQSDRVGATSAVAVQPGTNESKKPTGNEAKATHATESEQSNKDDHNDDHSTWETVEVRSRGNRKKASDRSNGRFASQQGAANSAGGQNGNASKKKFPRTSNSRIRNKTRKMIREIVFSVIDSVDEEVRKRRQAASWREGARLPGNKWAAAVAKGKAAEYGTRQTNSADTQKPNSQNEATMRDVLIGRQGSTRGVSGSSPQLTQRMYSERAHQRPDPRGDGKNVSSQHALDSKKSRGKLDRADQNTAPTVPETLSAMSANETLSTRNLQQRNTGAGRSDSSSGDSVEAVKPPHTSSQKGKEASPSPPLPTLLSPGNVNSASSSVASSLEAPRAGHHSNHHSFYPGNENDVGYHLLDVCDRLTRDIQVFMKRREHALEIRRRERGSVLAALQESLSVRNA